MKNDMQGRSRDVCGSWSAPWSPWHPDTNEVSKKALLSLEVIHMRYRMDDKIWLHRKGADWWWGVNVCGRGVLSKRKRKTV